MIPPRKMLRLLAHHEIWQPGYDRWEKGDQKKHDKQRNEKRRSAADNLFEGQPADLYHDEQYHAKRRGEQADHQIQDHDDPEVDGIDADLRDHLHKDRAEDQDGHDRLEEAANHEQEQIDYQQ